MVCSYSVIFGAELYWNKASHGNDSPNPIPIIPDFRHYVRSLIIHPYTFHDMSSILNPHKSTWVLHVSPNAVQPLVQPLASRRRCMACLSWDGTESICNHWVHLWTRCQQKYPEYQQIYCDILYVNTSRTNFLDIHIIYLKLHQDKKHDHRPQAIFCQRSSATGCLWGWIKTWCQHDVVG